MKFRLEATQDELRAKAPALLERLSKAFEYSCPEISEALEKALPAKESELKYRALRDIKDRTDAAYDAMLAAMLRDIGKVLDRAVTDVRKSEDWIDQLGRLLDEAGLKVVIRPELLKSKPPEKPEPRDGFEDFTKLIADLDEKKYDAVKAVALKELGYSAKDFEEGGPLYGKSTNELLDMLKEARKTE